MIVALCILSGLVGAFAVLSAMLALYAVSLRGELAELRSFLSDGDDPEEDDGEDPPDGDEGEEDEPVVHGPSGIPQAPSQRVASAGVGHRMADGQCGCEGCRLDRLAARTIQRHAVPGSTWGVSRRCRSCDAGEWPEAFVTRWGVA